MLLKRILILLFLLFSLNTYSNFIIKFEDGSTEISKYDPRISGSLALTSKSIAYVDEDILMKPHFVEGDDNFIDSQWIFVDYLNDSFEKAKSFEAQMGDVVVAVIDTGILNHEDLDDVLSGADFISDTSNSRDGDGRDLDPTDEGDYAPSDCRDYSNDSSWHGTHLSGIISSKSYNNIGVRGINNKAKILPVRVLGPCGGRTSDIADAIRWSIGMSVDGIAANPTPAKVVNLSLGGRGRCGNFLQEAIDEANQRGVLVVVSAGNDSSSIDDGDYTPVNCKGVFRVGSVHPTLTQSAFSNYGQGIDVYAPGDNIFATFNSGSTTALNDDYYSLSGTSMSAAVISGVAAGIFGLNPHITVDQVKNILATSGQSINCFYGNCEGKLSIDPERAYVRAINERRDDSFDYDEYDISPEVEQISTNDTFVQPTSDGGGCGTIIKDEDHSVYRLMSTMVLMSLMFVLFNAAIFFKEE